MTDKDNVVELVDEEGNIVKFNIEAYFEIEEDEYVVLTQELEEESIIMRIDNSSKDPVFRFIESKEELEEAIEAYESLISQNK